MALAMRTADKVAHSVQRFLGQSSTNPTGVALPTAAPSPTAGNWEVAHGSVGTDDCVLTVALDNTVAQTTVINCLYWSAKANQWLKAGANNGIYSKSFEAGGSDVFVLPEGSKYYLYGNFAISAGLVYVDGAGPNGNIDN
jgi:hypothetical protein